MMKFQVLPLAFVLVIATSIHCQVQPQLGDSDESPVANGHVISRRQVRNCYCSGRRTLEQNCPCEVQRQHGFLSKEQKTLCLKKGITMYRKCQQLTGGNRKEKKVNKGSSMPI